MYKIYVTNYNNQKRELVKEYSDMRMLKNRAFQDLKVHMSDNNLEEKGNWDFSIFKVTDGNEVEFGNKDILFLFV